MPRPKFQGLQVPQKLELELRFFLEAVKERLEIMTGERGDPLQRAVMVDDLKRTGVVKVATKGTYAELIGPGSEAGGSESSSAGETQSIENALSLFSIEADALDDDHILIVWDKTTGSYRRVEWEDFAALFVTSEGAYSPQLRHAGVLG